MLTPPLSRSHGPPWEPVRDAPGSFLHGENARKLGTRYLLEKGGHDTLLLKPLSRKGKTEFRIVSPDFRPGQDVGCALAHRRNAGPRWKGGARRKESQSVRERSRDRSGSGSAGGRRPSSSPDALAHTGSGWRATLQRLAGEGNGSPRAEHGAQAHPTLCGRPEAVLESRCPRAYREWLEGDLAEAGGRGQRLAAS